MSGFNPSPLAAQGFRVLFAGSMAGSLLEQSRIDSGLHSSWSGEDHLSIRSDNGKITGHLFSHRVLKNGNPWLLDD